MGDPFLSLTGHYIVTSVENPQEWELKTNQLAFMLIKGDHSRANMLSIILSVSDWYGIRDKVSNCTTIILHNVSLNCCDRLDGSSLTSYNTSNNNVAFHELGNMLDPLAEKWDPLQRRIT